MRTLHRNSFLRAGIVFTAILIGITLLATSQAAGSDRALGSPVTASQTKSVPLIDRA